MFQNLTKFANTPTHNSVGLQQRVPNWWALDEVHTHAQRLVLTSVAAEQSEFENRIGGAMCRMLQHRDHHVPAGCHFASLVICSTTPIGHGIVTMRKPLQSARETGWPSG